MIRIKNKILFFKEIWNHHNFFGNLVGNIILTLLLYKSIVRNTMVLILGVFETTTKFFLQNFSIFGQKSCFSKKNFFSFKFRFFCGELMFLVSPFPTTFALVTFWSERIQTYVSDIFNLEFFCLWMRPRRDAKMDLLRSFYVQSKSCCIWSH